MAKKTNRAKQVQVDNKPSSLDVGLYDIDSSIKYYFDNTIIPTILDKNGAQMQVPVVYGSPEKWKSMQKSSFYRDANGKIQVPLIMYKRTGITKRNDMSSKIDSNYPQVAYAESKDSQTNKYDLFSKQVGLKPVKQYHKVVIPDYVKLTYECIIWTDYLKEMNNIIEAISYAEGTYWGDPDKFSFMSRIDSFAQTTDVEIGNDRLIRSSFTIELDGFIISDNVQKRMATGGDIAYGPAKISIGHETVVDINQLKSKL